MQMALNQYFEVVQIAVDSKYHLVVAIDVTSNAANKKGRIVTLTEYQEYYDRADKRFAENLELYKKRQMLVEHPFGTVK
jgi:hypothetical protein